MGTTISLPMPHGTTEAYVAGDAAHPPVIFFMDGLGWRPTLFEMADRTSELTSLRRRESRTRSSTSASTRTTRTS